MCLNTCGVFKSKALSPSTRYLLSVLTKCEQLVYTEPVFHQDAWRLTMVKSQFACTLKQASLTFSLQPCWCEYCSISAVPSEPALKNERSHQQPTRMEIGYWQPMKGCTSSCNPSPQPCWWNKWFCVRHRMRVGSAYQEIREMSAPTTNN